MSISSRQQSAPIALPHKCGRRLPLLAPILILAATIIALAAVLTPLIRKCYTSPRHATSGATSEVRDRADKTILRRSSRVAAYGRSLTPRRASAFLRMPIMANNCPHYQPAKCWRTGATGATVRCDGDCSRCSIGDLSNIPTFAQAIEAYDTRCRRAKLHRHNTANVNRALMAAFFRHSGLTLDNKVTALTDEAWEHFLASARGNLAPAYIQSIASRVHSVFGPDAQRRAPKSLGWDSWDLPDLSVDRVATPWVSLTPDERRKIRDYQFSLFQLSDPRKFLCVTAAWERGRRRSDVLRNHWSQFVMRDGVVWWPYVANKTGKSSDWPVDPDTWRMLQIARRRLAELNVRNLGRHSDSYLRVKDYPRDAVIDKYAAWDSCSADLRELMGWSGAKAMHNLRKDACDTVFQHLGIDAAEEFSTDTAQTLRRHYVARKRISPSTISIAKM